MTPKQHHVCANIHIAIAIATHSILFHMELHQLPTTIFSWSCAWPFMYMHVCTVMYASYYCNNGRLQRGQHDSLHTVYVISLSSLQQLHSYCAGAACIYQYGSYMSVAYIQQSCLQILHISSISNTYTLPPAKEVKIKLQLEGDAERGIYFFLPSYYSGLHHSFWFQNSWPQLLKGCSNLWWGIYLQYRSLTSKLMQLRRTSCLLCNVERERTCKCV